MDQIVGAIILSAVIMAGTALVGMGVHHLTVTKKERLISERMERKLRVAVNERLVKEGLHKLYADEAEKRKEAETKVGIMKNQLRKKDAEIERLKGLLKEAERRTSDV